MFNELPTSVATIISRLLSDIFNRGFSFSPPSELKDNPLLPELYEPKQDLAINYTSHGFLIHHTQVLLCEDSNTSTDCSIYFFYANSNPVSLRCLNEYYVQQLLAHIDASILYAKQLHQSTTSDQYVLYDVVRELQLRRFYWAAKLIKAFETINSKGEKLVIDKNQIFQTILTQTLSEIVGHLSPLNSQTAECLKSIKHLYQDLFAKRQKVQVLIMPIKFLDKLNYIMSVFVPTKSEATATLYLYQITSLSDAKLLCHHQSFYTGQAPDPLDLKKLNATFQKNEKLLFESFQKKIKAYHRFDSEEYNSLPASVRQAQDVSQKISKIGSDMEVLKKSPDKKDPQTRITTYVADFFKYITPTKTALFDICYLASFMLTIIKFKQKKDVPLLEYAAKLQAVLAYFNIESFALSFEMAELMLQEIFSTGKIYSEISPQKIAWLAGRELFSAPITLEKLEQMPSPQTGHSPASKVLSPTLETIFQSHNIFLTALEIVNINQGLLGLQNDKKTQLSHSELMAILPFSAPMLSPEQTAIVGREIRIVKLYFEKESERKNVKKYFSIFAKPNQIEEQVDNIPHQINALERNLKAIFADEIKSNADFLIKSARLYALYKKALSYKNNLISLFGLNNELREEFFVNSTWPILFKDDEQFYSLLLAYERHHKITEAGILSDDLQTVVTTFDFDEDFLCSHETEVDPLGIRHAVKIHRKITDQIRAVLETIQNIETIKLRMSQYKPAMLYQGSKYVELPINLNELHGWLQISAKMAIKFIDSLEYSGELQNIDMNNIATTKFYKFYSDKNTAFIIPLHAHFNLTAIQELINAAILQAMACHGWQGLEFSLWQPDFQEPLENASVGYKDLLEYANNFYIACYNITMGLNEGLQSISDQSMQAIYTVAKKQMHLKGLTRSSMPKTKQNTTEEKPTEELPSNSRHV